MTDDDPWPRPTRTEPRGDFPAHDPRPGRQVLTLEQAARLAWARLQTWRDEHE